MFMAPDASITTTDLTTLATSPLAFTAHSDRRSATRLHARFSQFSL